MTKLLIVLGCTLSLQSYAATLAPGETANINGTAVTCASSSGEACKLVRPDSCGLGAAQVVLNGSVLTDCKWLKDALVDLKSLKDAGACN